MPDKAHYTETLLTDIHNPYDEMLGELTGRMIALDPIQEELDIECQTRLRLSNELRDLDLDVPYGQHPVLTAYAALHLVLADRKELALERRVTDMRHTTYPFDVSQFIGQRVIVRETRVGSKPITTSKMDGNGRLRGLDRDFAMRSGRVTDINLNEHIGGMMLFRSFGRYHAVTPLVSRDYGYAPTVSIGRV